MRNGFIKHDGTLIPVRSVDQTETHDGELAKLGRTWDTTMHRNKWIKVRQGCFMFSKEPSDALDRIKTFLQARGNQSDYGDTIYVVDVEPYGIPSMRSFSYSTFERTGQIVWL
jgi:hypothetical protein